MGSRQLCLPVVVGNHAWGIGKDGDGQGSTHRWRVYVRSPVGPHHDLSPIIRKVQFQLHDTFPNPKRSVDRHPFVLEETGWGEFEVLVKLSFTDPAQRPVTLTHILRLYPDGLDANSPQPLTSRDNPLVFEACDEVLFVSLDAGHGEHTAQFRDALVEHHKAFQRSKGWKEWCDAEAADVQLLEETRRKVQERMRELATRISQLDNHKARLEKECASLAQARK